MNPFSLEAGSNRWQERDQVSMKADGGSPPLLSPPLYWSLLYRPRVEASEKLESARMYIVYTQGIHRVHTQGIHRVYTEYTQRATAKHERYCV